MRVEAAKQAASGRTGTMARDAQPAHDERHAESRALVVQAPTSAHQPLAMSYRQTAFLAHLIATAQREPQTRDRRRAEPAEAAAAYDVTKAGRILSGRNLSRAM